MRARGLERAAGTSGCVLCGGRFEVELLGRSYLFSPGPPSVEPEASDTEKACIARYVMLARPLPDLTPVSLAQVPRARNYVNPFRGRVLGAFLGVFGRAPERLARAAESLGGRKAPYGEEAPASSSPRQTRGLSLSKAVESWAVRVFSLIELSFVLRPGDDEFGPDATVLFPRGLFDVFEVEDAVVMAELTSRALVRAVPR